ncbi:MAG: 4-phosphoerythronate dehydrogenase [Planctomycetota bacterium]
MKIVADENIPFVKECFSSIGSVITVSGRGIKPELLNDADMLFVRSITSVNQQLLEKSSVRFVATATIGVEHVDTDYLASRNIGFAFAPGSNSNSVAEYIVAALLTLAGKFRFQLADKSIGIVGVGNVGSKVEKKCRALGMNVLLNDPPLQRQTNNPKYLPLQRLFDCDFITMHTPLTHEGIDRTFHLANKDFFDSLRQGAFFINTSRGAVVDTIALKDAISSQKLGGAVLDVWENEPSIDCELLRKVSLSTPHIAGYSYDGKVNGMIMTYEAACRYFDLQPEHTAENFLPQPQIPEITIDSTGNDEQTILYETVQQIYNINRDDFNTREILMVPPETRSRFFDDLRKNYPVRREFQNTRIILKKPDKSLQKKLAGIGYKI